MNISGVENYSVESDDEGNDEVTILSGRQNVLSMFWLLE